MISETVLLGGFAYQTNTFAPDKTDRELFQDRREYVGDAIAENMKGQTLARVGPSASPKRKGPNLVHTVAATVTPGGVVEAETYEFCSVRSLYAT